MSLLPEKYARDPRRALVLVLRLSIAAVFIYTAIDKIIHQDRYADVIFDYAILPGGAANLFSVCVPWVEVVAAVSLVFGVWLASGALASSGLVATFAIAMAAALIFGAEKFDCGCYSTLEEGRAQVAWLLVRDGVLLAACLWVLRDAVANETAEDTH